MTTWKVWTWMERLTQAENLRRGNRAEQAACNFLRQSGLELLMRNYRCRFGEIDLVMTDRDIVVFVEVRFRTSRRFGGAIESVDGPKQRKLQRSAQSYLQRHRHLAERPCRFDVIAITQENNSDNIEWIRNAF